MTTINITGLDLAEVLAGLYNNTRALGMGALHDRGSMSVEDARQALRDGSPDPGNQRGPMRFDYLYGRPLKVKFDESGTIDVQMYDRDAGEGTAARVIGELRARQSAGARP